MTRFLLASHMSALIVIACSSGCTGSGSVLPEDNGDVTVVPNFGVAGEKLSLTAFIDFSRPVDGKLDYFWAVPGNWGSVIEGQGTRTPKVSINQSIVSDLHFIELAVSYNGSPPETYQIPFFISKTPPGGGGGGTGAPTATASGVVRQTTGGTGLPNVTVFASRINNEAEIRRLNPNALGTGDIYGSKVVTSATGEFLLSGLPQATPLSIVAFRNIGNGEWNPQWDIQTVTLGAEGVSDIELVLPNDGGPAIGLPGGIVGQVFMPVSGGTGPPQYATGPLRVFVTDPPGPPPAHFDDKPLAAAAPEIFAVPGFIPGNAPGPEGWFTTEGDLNVRYPSIGDGNEIRISIFREDGRLWWSGTMVYHAAPVVNVFPDRIELHP